MNEAKQNKSSLDQQNEILLKQDNQLNLDEILRIIGFGLYQQRIYLALGLLGLCEGAQIQIYTLILEIQKKEFDMSQKEINLSSSFLFLGFLIGSFTSGFLSDKLGRGGPCYSVTILLTIFQTFISLAQNTLQLILIRTFTAFMIGILSPLACTILTEITPSKNRGKFMAILAISFSVGQLYGVFLSYINLSKDLTDGNWRKLNIESNYPAILSVILQTLYLDESIRFEFIKGDIDKAFQIIDKMCITNLKINLNLVKPGAREELILWKQSYDEKTLQNAYISDLLKPKYRKITLILWYNWIALSFSYFGMILYVPNILKVLNLQKLSKFDNVEMVYSVCFEILGLILGAMIIDHKSFGRKNSMIILFFLCSISSLLTQTHKSNFIEHVTISKILLNNIMNFCFQYTSEVYPTEIRTSGIGFAQGVGKTSGVLLPFVCGFLEDKQVGSCFYLFSFLQFVSIITSYNLPFDTTGISLDNVNKQIEKQQENSQN